MTPAPPAQDPRQTRHSTRRVLRARELREVGWSPRQIRLMIADEFGLDRPPSKTTIRQWTEPGFVETERKQRAAAYARHHGSGKPGRFLTDAVLLALREEDELTYPSIAAVVRRFFGVEMTGEQVRGRLYALGVEKNPNKVRAMREHNLRRAAA